MLPLCLPVMAPIAVLTINAIWDPPFCFPSQVITGVFSGLVVRGCQIMFPVMVFENVSVIKG